MPTFDGLDRTAPSTALLAIGKQAWNGAVRLEIQGTTNRTRIEGIRVLNDEFTDGTEQGDGQKNDYQDDQARQPDNWLQPLGEQFHGRGA